MSLFPKKVEYPFNTSTKSHKTFWTAFNLFKMVPVLLLFLKDKL